MGIDTAASRPEEPVGTPATRRKVVLVVEDDRAIGELIAAAISDEPGYFAIHVEEPTGADLMVLDVRLPGMSGFELYDRLQTDPRTRKVPVLFETASGSETIDEFHRRGIATYVKKPFDLNELVAYVKRLASGQGPATGGPDAPALPPHA